MSLQMNQFSMTPLKGALALILNPSTISCQVDPASVATTILPGCFVKLVATADGYVPIVDKSAATDVSFGVVLWNPKKELFSAGDAVEVAFLGSIVWAEASAAIDRGAQLEFVATGNKVVTATGNPIVGFALDEFSGNGELGRIMVINPFTLAATITSGSINNVAIGGSTPAAGTFTNLTVTGIATFSGTIAGGSPFVFEGATADAFETTLAVTDPTADNIVTIPDSSGGTFDLLNQTALVITPGATPSWAPGANRALSTLTPGENETIAATTTGALKGKIYIIEVVTSGTSTYTLTFGTAFKTTGTLATGATTAKTFILAFVFDGTNFVEVSRTTAM